MGVTEPYLDASPSSLQERFMSLEKEVFPFMAHDGELFAFDLEGKFVV